MVPSANVATALSALLCLTLVLPIGYADDASAAAVVAPPPVEDPRVTAFLARVSRSYLDSFVDPAKNGNPAVWSEANTLEALTVLFDGTGDRRVLDELAFHIDALINRTSAALDRPDELRGVPVAAWPTGKYSCGVCYAHAVHTGVLAYSIAWFARRVLERPDELQADYGDLVRPYIDAARAALEVHAAELGRSGNTAWYNWPTGLGAALGNCDGEDWAAREGTELPCNQMITPARAALHLAAALELTGASAEPWRTDAIAIGRTFRQRLTHRSDIDAYEWLYTVGGRPEDASHGSIDMRFAAQLFYEEGALFSPTEMDRFARTFTELLAVDPDRVRSHVSETYGGTRDGRWQRGAVRWLALAPLDRGIYDLSRYIFFNAEGDSRLGEVLLIRHKPDAEIWPAWLADYDGLPVDDLRGSMQPSGYTGLYRTSTSPLADVDGSTVSSCALWTFEAEHTTPIALRYRHTADPIAGASCGGTSCGTAPGFLVWSGTDGTTWTRRTVPAPLAETWRTESIDPGGVPWSQVLGCRSGAGHARDNLEVRWVRTAP